MIGADSSIESGDVRMAGERLEATGGAEAPPQVGACFVFIVMAGLLFLFVDPFPPPSGFGKRPPISGVSSKRIALEADTAIIQPVRVLLQEQFYCSLSGGGVNPNG